MMAEFDKEAGRHLLGVVCVPGGGAWLEDGARAVPLWRLQPGIWTCGPVCWLAVCCAIGSWLGCQLGLCQSSERCRFLATSPALKCLEAMQQ